MEVAMDVEMARARCTHIGLAPKGLDADGHHVWLRRVVWQAREVDQRGGHLALALAHATALLTVARCSTCPREEDLAIPPCGLLAESGGECRSIRLRDDERRLVCVEAAPSEIPAKG